MPGFLLALWQPAGPLPIGYPSCPRECQLLEASITRKPTPIKCSGDSTLFGCKFRFLAPGKRRNRRNGFRRNDFTGFAKIGHYFRVARDPGQSRETVSKRLQASSLLTESRRECDWAVATVKAIRARKEKESACCLTRVASRHRVPQTFVSLRPASAAHETFWPEAASHRGEPWPTN